MRKIKKPKIGEYVFVSMWSDHNPFDSWYIGHIYCIIEYENCFAYKLKENGREWRYVFRITKEEGEELLKLFGERD